MKPYGVRRKDRGCCPGHDKFPADRYASKASQYARSRDKQLAHGIARARANTELRRTIKEI